MAPEVAVRNVPASELRTCVTGIFGGIGLRPADAAVVADTLVEADLRGVRSHGVMRVAGYVRGLRSGSIRAQPNIQMVKDSATLAVMDADGGMGQVGAHAAMRQAIEKARQTGFGAVGLRNSRHCGAMAYYSMMAAAEGFLGFATTNAGINMAPWGGRTRLVGNNPFSYAVPTAQPYMMVLDMATSVAAGGKLDMAIIQQKPIPPDWALGGDGKPTTDPLEARNGSLLPVGGPKGYALALFLDVFSGILPGARFGAGLGPDGKGEGSGHFFSAMSIDFFAPKEEFLRRMDMLIGQLKGSALTEGSKAVFIPGEIEHNLREERLKAGIPIETPILDELEKEAVTLGLECRPSRW